MISEDIELTNPMLEFATNHPELEAMTQNLSITTFRYIPTKGLPTKSTKRASYLNTLNETLLDNLQQGGEVFLSNAIIQEKYCLRGCIVNFRTSVKDIKEIIEIVVKVGAITHQELINRNNEYNH